MKREEQLLEEVNAETARKVAEVKEKQLQELLEKKEKRRADMDDWMSLKPYKSTSVPLHV